MRMTFVFIALTFGCVAYADQPPTAAPKICMTESEALELYRLTIAYEIAKGFEPTCVDMTGAMACLPPFDQSSLDWFRIKQRIDLIHLTEYENIRRNPSCVELRGAGACLPPYVESELTYLYTVVPECKPTS